MSREATLLRAVAAALVVAGCASASPTSGGLFDDAEARRQIARQQTRIDEVSAQLDRVSARTATLEEALKNQPVQPVFEIANQIQLLREEVKALRGQIEVVNNSIEGTAKRQRDMYVDLDTRLRRVEQAAAAPPPVLAPPAGTPEAGAAAAPPAVAPPAGTAPPSAGVPSATDEARAYEAAQAMRRIGNYQGAIAAFQAFIAQYPRSTLAPRAQYWIGDSYFNLRDFPNAIASQQKLLAAYGDSSSVPDALLNIASSQLEMGDTAAARKTMDGLVSRYPSSEAAEKARRRLATLK